MTAIIRIHDLRANQRTFLELIPGDMSAVYGPRLPMLLRGEAVMQGHVMHKIYRVGK